MGVHDSTEWRAFMTAKKEFTEAQRIGTFASAALEEIEAIAMHTEIRALRERAREFLFAEQQRKTATA